MIYIIQKGEINFTEKCLKQTLLHFNFFLDFFLVDVTEEDLKGRVIDALLPLHLKYKIDDDQVDVDICIKLGQMVFEGIVNFGLHT